MKLKFESRVCFICASNTKNELIGNIFCKESERMTVLFLTLVGFNSFEEHNIYTDLLREFVRNGHEVYCISPSERRARVRTQLLENGHILKLRIGNTQKTNIIEKGISTLLIEDRFVEGVKKFFSRIKFDLVLYSTPPITFEKAVRFIKKRDHARTYLLLKDIFPQNAVDLGMMSTTGIKSCIYKYFRNKEMRLYALSDRIGCMSQANVDYVLKHNSRIAKEIVEVCPNSIEPIDFSVSEDKKVEIRKKYGIPLDKIVFIYGGNLGEPQGIPFIIKCLDSQKCNEKVFFLVIGDGTEYGKLEKFVKTTDQKNLKLMHRLPKDDYDLMVGSCDIGMIFLNHRFSIPNFPSRLLAYMQAKIPVLAVTDPHTDIGEVIVNNGFGWWCESNDVKAFSEKITEISNTLNKDMGALAWTYLTINYSIKISYKIIIDRI